MYAYQTKHLVAKFADLPDAFAQEKEKGFMARISTNSNEWRALGKIAGYNAKKLAALSCCSVRQLEREFNRSVGQPPQQWLDNLRLARASEKLLHGEAVKMVAMDLGYKQVSHFCRRFKRRFQMTPSQFVDSHRKCPNPVADG